MVLVAEMVLKGILGGDLKSGDGRMKSWISKQTGSRGYGIFQVKRTASTMTQVMKGLRRLYTNRKKPSVAESIKVNKESSRRQHCRGLIM